jgi:hypothetical protein
MGPNEIQDQRPRILRVKLLIVEKIEESAEFAASLG